MNKLKDFTPIISYNNCVQESTSQSSFNNKYSYFV